VYLKLVQANSNLAVVLCKRLYDETSAVLESRGGNLFTQISGALRNLTRNSVSFNIFD